MSDRLQLVQGLSEKYEVEDGVHHPPGLQLDNTPVRRPITTALIRLLLLALLITSLLLLRPLVLSFYFSPTSPFRLLPTISNSTTYQLGLGIADITGPIVEINMMGYADSKQLGTGLHMRLRSRAFVVSDEEGRNRWVLVNADICMGDTAIRLGVIEKLQELYPGIYTDTNVALVGTHSHAGIAGFHHNVLPQITARGFMPQNYHAIVSGIVLSIQRAHNSLFSGGTLEYGSREVLHTNINRSPFAYMANPREERERWRWDVDKDLHLLRFSSPSPSPTPRGFASFFPVHGTSLYLNNTLISGDNKGLAAFLSEAYFEPSSLPGNTSFVAGFFQSNVGDTSPNTLGAYCETGEDAGKECTYENSTCNGVAAGCQGRGPAFPGSDFESNRIIADNQFNAARALVEDANLAGVSGPVRSVHVYVDMSEYTFMLANGSIVTTCPSAMGYGFAGGTSDGAGYFDFTQNRNGTEENPFWKLVKLGIGGSPSSYQAMCHAPKPILMNTGYAHSPYDWSPQIVDIQMFRVGQVVILVVPAEFTTMAGRRLVEAVRSQLKVDGILGDDATVILTGPANTYSHYVSTREEYNIQRYEGASTIYGPFTLEAYIDIYTSLVPYLSEDLLTKPDPGPSPPDFRGQAISLQRGVITDRAPFGKPFGTVLTDVDTSRPYRAGQSVSVLFQGANPRNDLRLEGTYLAVERADDNVPGGWKVVRTDSHPSTTLQWERTSTARGTSTVNITWVIEPETTLGFYRIRYFGDAKALIGGIRSFTGVSKSFTVRQ